MKFNNLLEERFYADLVRRRAWQLVDAYKKRVMRERKEQTLEVDLEQLKQDELNYDFDVIELLQRRKNEAQQSVLKLLLRRYNYDAQNDRIIDRSPNHAGGTDTQCNVKGERITENSCEHAQADTMPAKNYATDDGEDKRQRTEDIDEQNQKQVSCTDCDDNHDDHNQEQNEEYDSYDDDFLGGDTEEREDDDGEEIYDDHDLFDTTDYTSASDDEEQEPAQQFESQSNANLCKWIEKFKDKPAASAAVNQARNVPLLGGNAHWSDLEDEAGDMDLYHIHDYVDDEYSDYDNLFDESDTESDNDDKFRANSFTKVD